VRDAQEIGWLAFRDQTPACPKFEQMLCKLRQKDRPDGYFQLTFWALGGTLI